MFINLFKILLSSHSRWLSIRSMPRSCSWQISPHPSPHFVILGHGSKWRVALPHWGPQSFYGSRTNDNTNDNVHKLFRISLFSWQLPVRHVGFKPSEDGKSKSNELCQQDVLALLFCWFHCWVDTRFFAFQIKRK